MLHDPHFVLVDTLHKILLGHEDHRVQHLADCDTRQQPQQQVKHATWQGLLQRFQRGVLEQEDQILVNEEKCLLRDRV